MPVAILSSFRTRARSRASVGRVALGRTDPPLLGETLGHPQPLPPAPHTVPRRTLQGARRQGTGPGPWSPAAAGKDGRAPTAGDAEHTHDADDGGVDGQGRVHLDLLQRDAHDGQQHDGQVQLVPPGGGRRAERPGARPTQARPGGGGLRRSPTLPRGSSAPCVRPAHLSLKNLRNPKATSFSAASKTKTTVNT